RVSDGSYKSYEARVGWVAWQAARRTPAPVGVEPVAWSTGVAWHPDSRSQSEMVLKLTRRAQPMYGYTVPLYATPQPTQAQAGAVPLIEELIEATEQLMDWQVKNVKRWHNPAYDFAHR